MPECMKVISVRGGGGGEVGRAGSGAGVAGTGRGRRGPSCWSRGVPSKVKRFWPAKLAGLAASRSVMMGSRC